ncbi:MAG: carboxypeptidase regulatory-like domain-containing protein [Candidatus Hydrogenedentes bacterium]|nr:carboxypeptidase regulatory-like domain-containing protein [Candidatus Hydrogenedentota bacterium]
MTPVLHGVVLEKGTDAPVPQFRLAVLEEFPTSVSTTKSILADSSTPWQAQESPSGSFELAMERKTGQSVLAVSAEGFEPAFLKVDTAAFGDASPYLHVRLTALTGFRGQVLNTAGEPVPGAALYRGESQAGDVLAQSGKDGLFTFALDSLEETPLHVTHPEYLSTTITVNPVRRKMGILKIALQRGASVTGKVRRGDSPLSGAQVTVYDGFEFTRLSVTEADGAYSVEGVPPGEVEVRAEMPYTEGRPAWALQRRAVTVEDKNTVVDIRFASASGSVAGEVSIGGMAPAGGIIEAQSVSAGGDTFMNARLDANGAYALPNVAAGEVWLDATIESADGVQRRWQTRFEISEGEHRIEDILFNTGGAILCSIPELPQEADATLLLFPEGVRMSAEDFSGDSDVEEQAVLHTPLNGKTEMELTNIDPGNYTLCVIVVGTAEGEVMQAEGPFRIHTQSVAVKEGMPTAVSIEMQPGM